MSLIPFPASFRGHDAQRAHRSGPKLWARSIAVCALFPHVSSGLSRLKSQNVTTPRPIRLPEAPSGISCELTVAAPGAMSIRAMMAGSVVDSSMEDVPRRRLRSPPNAPDVPKLGFPVSSHGQARQSVVDCAESPSTRQFCLMLKNRPLAIRP